MTPMITRLLTFLSRFAAYALLGWLIEAAYLTARHLPLIRGLLYPLPFKPAYGVGGLLVVAVSGRVSRWPLLAQWAALSVLLGAYELAVGSLTVAVLRQRLWEYRGTFLNVFGHTDLFHAAAWGALGVAAIHVIQPFLKRIRA